MKTSTVRNRADDIVTKGTNKAFLTGVGSKDSWNWKTFEYVSNNGYERKSKRGRFNQMYRKLKLTLQE